MVRGAVLVTGGTGLVGSHIIDRLLETGYTIRAIVRPESHYRHVLAGDIEIFEGCFWDEGLLNTAVSGCEAFVHCAAKVGDWGAARDYRAVNVDSLANIFSVVRAHSLRFIYVSSLGVYPLVNHSYTRETDPIAAKGFDGYTSSKIEAERLVTREIEGGLPATILRPGFVYGPRDRTVLPKLLQSLRKGRFVFFGDGRQSLNNTYVKNLAAVVPLALGNDRAIGETFNITDDPVVDKLEFVRTVSELAELKVPRTHLPIGLGKFLAQVLDSGGRALRLRRAPPLTLAAFKFLGLDLNYSIEKAKSMLAYRPEYSFKRAISETMGWFEDKGEVW